MERKTWKLLDTTLYACNSTEKEAKRWADEHNASGIVETNHVVPEMFQDCLFEEGTMLKFCES
jgi:hypothetical protein